MLRDVVSMPPRPVMLATAYCDLSCLICWSCVCVSLSRAGNVTQCHSVAWLGANHPDLADVMTLQAEVGRGIGVVSGCWLSRCQFGLFLFLFRSDQPLSFSCNSASSVRINWANPSCTPRKVRSLLQCERLCCVCFVMLAGTPFLGAGVLTPVV